MSTPAQIQALIEKYTAPNPAENCTPAQAQLFANYMQELQMPYDDLVVQQTGGVPGADTMPLSAILAKGVPADTPLLIVGQNQQMSPDGPDGDPLTIGYTIALERARVGPLDGASAFVALYAARHVGTTQASALAAAEELPAVKAQVTSILRDLKVKSGV